MQLSKKSLSLTILLFLFHFTHVPAHAQVTGDVTVGSPTNVSCTVNGEDGINTALGCISVANSGENFVVTVFQISIGIGGSIALLLMLYGFFIVTTSAGLPDKIKAGKEIITSAVMGLLFILLSAFLLRLIGYDILTLPGF